MLARNKISLAGPRAWLWLERNNNTDWLKEARGVPCRPMPIFIFCLFLLLFLLSVLLFNIIINKFISNISARTSVLNKLKEICCFEKYLYKKFLTCPTKTPMLWQARSGKVRLIGCTRRTTKSYWCWGRLKFLKYRYLSSYIITNFKKFLHTTHVPHPTKHNI